MKKGVKMKLITFQTKEALKVLQKDGVLKANVAHIDLQKYGVPYDWIVHEMKKHKILPKQGEQYPLWAWAKCGSSIGPKKKKNINQITQNLVKIVFAKNTNEVLLSDYMAYSFILNGQIVPKDKKEYPNFLKQMESQGISLEDLKNFVRHQKIKPNIPINEIQKSWPRIFDLKSYVHQACVWNIKISEVITTDTLDDPNYIYGTMNAKRLDGSRPDWKNEYLKFLSD